MKHRLLRLALVGSVVVLATPLLTLASDVPADALPYGARARLGTARLRNPNGWPGATISPDGKYLILVSSQGLARIDVTTGDAAGSLGSKPAGLSFGGRVELDQNGTRGLTAGYNAVSVWDVKSGKILTELKRPTPYGEALADISADGTVLAVGGIASDKDKSKPVTAIVWDVDANARRAEVSVLQNQSAYVALSPNGKLLATWGNHFEPNPPKEGVDPATDPNRIVQFWDAATGKELSKVRLDGFGSSVVAFAPDGQVAALSHGSGGIRIVDPRTGTEKRRLFGRGNQGFRLAIAPDGKTLASAGSDGVVQLWNLEDGSRLGLIECPLGPLPGSPREIRFTAADRAVVWATLGSAAIVWEVPSGKLLSPVEGHFSSVKSIVISADGKEILTGGSDGRILKWASSSGKPAGSIRLQPPMGLGGPQLSVSTIELTKDGKSAIVGQGGSGIYELSSGRQLAAPTAALGYDPRPYLCEDGRTLVAVPSIPFPPRPVPKSLKAEVWDVETGAKLAVLEFSIGDLSCAAATSDRSKLITGLTTRSSEAGQSAFLVSAWDLSTGRKLGEETRPGGFGSTFLTPSPDNKSALLATPDGKLVVIDATKGKATREIDTGRRRLTSAPAFSADGKQFAVAFSTGFGPNGSATIRLYEAASGKVIREFGGHSSSITCLAFSPDGKTLASGSQDTTVLLWDIGG